MNSSGNMAEAARAISRQLRNSDLRRIMEIAPTLIYVFDHVENANVYSNQELGDMLGYSKIEIKAMGADLMPTIIHPDDLGAVFAHFGVIKELPDHEIATLEYRVRHKAGHWVWLLSRDTVFLRDQDGAVVQHIGAALDMSAQKSAEAETRAAEKKTRATNEELREFAYSVSHDMKAPSNTLQLILSELDEALNPAPGTDVAELMGMAQKTVTNMRFLIEDVLHYTQIVGQDMAIETVDLDDVFSSLGMMLRAEISERGAKMKVPDLPRVRGSQSQLMILFQNLMQNAMKFTADGVIPQVQVTATTAMPGQSVTISVCDNGIGIAKEKHAQVFKMFKRLNPEERYGGTGLGLATCRRIAVNHKTTIDIASSPGEGAVFSITLEAA